MPVSFQGSRGAAGLAFEGPQERGQTRAASQGDHPQRLVRVEGMLAAHGVRAVQRPSVKANSGDFRMELKSGSMCHWKTRSPSSSRAFFRLSAEASRYSRPGRRRRPGGSAAYPWWMALQRLLAELDRLSVLAVVETGLDLGDGIGHHGLGRMELGFAQGKVDLGPALHGEVARGLGVHLKCLQGLCGLGVLAGIHLLQGLREGGGQRGGEGWAGAGADLGADLGAGSVLAFVAMRDPQDARETIE